MMVYANANGVKPKKQAGIGPRIAFRHGSGSRFVLLYAHPFRFQSPFLSCCVAKKNFCLGEKQERSSRSRSRSRRLMEA